MTPDQIAALAAEHVYPSYATVADEVYGTNPQCSCGVHNCPVPGLLADLAEARRLLDGARESSGAYARMRTEQLERANAAEAKVEAVRVLPAATLQRTSPSDRIANAWDEGAAYQHAATIRAIGDNEERELT